MRYEIKFGSRDYPRQEEIREILGSFEFALPRYTRSVYFGITTKSDLSGEADHRREYGQLCIYLTNETLSSETVDYDELRDIIVHEIAHGYNEPTFKLWNETVVNTFDDDTQRSTIAHVLRRECEVQTCDLADMLLDVYHEMERLRGKRACDDLTKSMKDAKFPPVRKGTVYTDSPAFSEDEKG